MTLSDGLWTIGFPERPEVGLHQSVWEKVTLSEGLRPSPLFLQFVETLGCNLSPCLEARSCRYREGCVIKFLNGKESTRTDNGEPLVTGIVEIVMLLPGRQAARVQR